MSGNWDGMWLPCIAMILGQGHGGGVCRDVDKVVSKVVESLGQ